MPTGYTTYYCDICEKGYEYYSQAIACELKGRPKPRFKVGEIVTAKYHRPFSSIVQSRPAKILKIYSENHYICIYKIEFVHTQDRIKSDERYYSGWDNKNARKDTAIVLYKRYKRMVEYA